MDDRKSKKIGKKAEPTEEELEFIYERLLTMSDDAVRDEIEEESTFPPRSTGFIKRRRRELKVAEKVLAKRAEGAYDTDEFERQKRHRYRLSERAQELLNQLQTYFPYIENYSTAEIAIDNDDFACMNLMTDFRSKCLLSHMQAELPELKQLKGWDDLRIRDIDSHLLDAVGRCAERQEFVGKCEVCEDWE